MRVHTAFLFFTTITLSLCLFWIPEAFAQHAPEGTPTSSTAISTSQNSNTSNAGVTSKAESLPQRILAGKLAFSDLNELSQAPKTFKVQGQQIYTHQAAHSPQAKQNEEVGHAFGQETILNIFESGQSID